MAHAHGIENSVHGQTEKIFGPFRSFQLQASAEAVAVVSSFRGTSRQ
jgi:hypothetical protein